MKNILFLAIIVGCSNMLYAQDKKPSSEKVYNTFKDTRVINTHSTETLKKRTMDIRISHRFGDFISEWKLENAWRNFLGLENAADISIGVDYGVTDDLTLGFYRTKGYGPLKQLLHGVAKYRILHQTEDNKMPLSLTAVGLGTMSTMKASENTQTVSHMPKFAHRFVYSLQFHAARKFGNVFSLQLSPMFTWRNYVPRDEQNYLFSMNICSRIQVSKMIGIILDASIPFSAMHLKGDKYQIPIGIGIEFETGGHVFQFNLSNSAGIMATDYIPNTTGAWYKGQFRIGFTISRSFRL
ncbi:MAG: hypothetical protein GY810_24145 [Aureispira sp.]|nr:hypothetical protein [Aureispira sp.]